MSERKLRDEFIKLLEEDVEFRYIVMGFLGIREILERIDKNTEAIKSLEEQIRNLQEQVRSLQYQVVEHGKVIRDLQEQVLEHSKAIRSLQEQVRNLQEQVRNLQRQVTEHSKAIINLQEQVKSLQQQVFELVKEIKELSDRVSALGARWGIIAEEVFTESLRRFLREYFKVAKIDVWEYYDEKGFVYGHPSVIEVDLVIKDRIHYLVEVKSSASKGDVSEIYRIGILYEKKTGIKPQLIIVTCFIDEKAKKLAEKLGVKVITY